MAVVVRVALVLLAVLAFTGCTTAPKTTVVAAPTGPVRQILPNGMRVVVDERHASDVVALQLWVRAGARDETASELGLAHYLEHVLFKGTTTRPLGSIEREVEGVGGRINAATSLDYTYLHALLPAARTEAGIELLADIAANASLEESALEREKRVVLEEMSRVEDDPRRSLLHLLYASTFEGHVYGRAVLGSAGVIRSMTREAAMSFYRRFWVPEAFTLVVVGHVSAREVLAVASRAFGRLPRTGWDRLPPAAVPAPRAKRVAMARPGPRAYVALGWAGPKLDHADSPALDLLAGVLGDGRLSRLAVALRERLGIVTSINAAWAPLEGAGLLSVVAETDAPNVERVEAEIIREMRRIREEGISEKDRARAVTRAIARHEFAEETVEGRAAALGRAATTWRLEDELAWVDRLRAVTPEQIQTVARRYLDLQRYARVAFVPGARS